MRRGKMHFKKLGKIFDPTNYKLPNNCEQFAQSPQALVFLEHVRIYFSTRKLDQENGKYLSHISYVDMEKDLGRIIRVSDRPVISLGELGAFDEHGIFPMNVLQHGGVIYGYTCGWNRRVSVSVDTAIGLALSQDNGHSFQRIGAGPLLAASLNEPCLVGDPFVRVYDGVFHMWYIFGTGWRNYAENSAPDRTYKIGHAVSADGIKWEKNEAVRIISDRLGADECQALPTVIKISDQYHMLFCYRQSYDFRNNKDNAYRIGYACSDDLVHWWRDDEALTFDDNGTIWDSDMMCYPHLFECGEKIYLLYNGNEFGRYGFGAAELV